MTTRTADAANVLIEHPSIPSTSRPTGYLCPSCPEEEIAGPNSPTHARHQARALAEAGLLSALSDLTRVEIDQRLGYPPHVLIKRGDEVIVNGYVAPDAYVAQLIISERP
jgi:hypothetical protein